MLLHLQCYLCSPCSCAAKHEYVSLIRYALIPRPWSAQCKTTPVGFEPTRGDPIGLAGRRLNRSAKVSCARLITQIGRKRLTMGIHVWLNALQAEMFVARMPPRRWAGLIWSRWTQSGFEQTSRYVTHLQPFNHTLIMHFHNKSTTPQASQRM